MLVGSILAFVFEIIPTDKITYILTYVVTFFISTGEGLC